MRKVGIMDITYTLTEEDYLKFNLYHIKNSKTGIRALNLQRFVPPLLFIVLAYLMTVVMEASFVVMIGYALVISIPWIVFYPAYFKRTIAQNAKKMLKEGDNEGLLGKQHMVTTDEGIIVNSGVGATNVSWAGLKKFKEDNDNFYLYNGSLSAYVLPKRDLINIEELRNYFIMKIGNQK